MIFLPSKLSIALLLSLYPHSFTGYHLSPLPRYRVLYTFFLDQSNSRFPRVIEEPWVGTVLHFTKTSGRDRTPLPQLIFSTPKVPLHLSSTVPGHRHNLSISSYSKIHQILFHHCLLRIGVPFVFSLSSQWANNHPRSPCNYGLTLP
jgi:hypothetical protein